MNWVYFSIQETKSLLCASWALQWDACSLTDVQPHYSFRIDFFHSVFIPRPLTRLLCLSDLYYWKFIIYSDKLIWKLYWSFRTEKVMWFKTYKACWRRQKTELIFETRPLGRRCLERRGWKHVLWEKVMNSKLQPQWRCPSHLRLSSELPSPSKICPQPSYPPPIPSWPCRAWSVRS